MKQERLDYLLQQYREEVATAEELHELQRFFDTTEGYEVFMNLVTKQLDEQIATQFDMEPYRNIPKKILSIDKPILQEPTKIPRVMPSVFKHWKGIAASFLLIGGFSFWFFNSIKDNNSGTVATKIINVKAPDKVYATITLADSTEISLDSLHVGTFHLLGGVNLIKTADGHLKYERDLTVVSPSIVYNTVTNPKGSKVVNMELSDGTKIWLNAGSSLTYPTIFTGAERKVVLQGQGYFEVAKLKNKQNNGTLNFEVLANGVTTQVHGTHFAIKAFSEDPKVIVTLLEGSVKVGYSGTGLKFIKPGQEATLDLVARDEMKVSTVEEQYVLAWKEGWFNFENRNLVDIVQELSRWYNVDVQYLSNNSTNLKLFGKVGNDLSLSQVMEVLKLLEVKCDLKNNKLIIN